MSITTATIVPTSYCDTLAATQATKGCSPRRLQSWADKVGLTVAPIRVLPNKQGTIVALNNTAGDPVLLAQGILARPAYGAALEGVKAILALQPKSAPAPAPEATTSNVVLGISPAWAEVATIRADQWTVRFARAREEWAAEAPKPARRSRKTNAA